MSGFAVNLTCDQAFFGGVGEERKGRGKKITPDTFI